MLPIFGESELADLIVKVENGKRLGFDEGLQLMNSNDILAIGYMANIVRERLHGNKTYFRTDRMELVTDGIMLPVGEVLPKNPEERVHRLLQLRALQDETGRINTFAPLSIDPKDIRSEGSMGVEQTTGFEDLRILAGARILLDNFKHIKAYWMMLGPKLAQVSLAFGVDELDGTVIEDSHRPSDDADRGHAITRDALIKMIRKAGRDPVERAQMQTDSLPGVQSK